MTIEAQIMAGAAAETAAFSMPFMATAAVFVVVLISMAAILYRVLYGSPRSQQSPQMPVGPPMPSPAYGGFPAPSTIQPEYCPECGVQNIARAPVCICGFDLKRAGAAPLWNVQPGYPPPSYVPPPVAPASMKRRAWAITDEKNARNTALQGMFGAFFVAVFTGAETLLPRMGMPLAQPVGPPAWLEIAIFVVLGCGIAKMSRTAAVGALVLYLFETIVNTHLIGMNPLTLTAMILCFVQGIRGTFAFHRFRAGPAVTG